MWRNAAEFESATKQTLGLKITKEGDDSAWRLANTCSKSRKMPPTNVTGTALRAPLTTCEVATLQAWLDEPLVTQMHRADDSSPTTPYPMPPFN